MSLMMSEVGMSFLWWVRDYAIYTWAGPIFAQQQLYTNMDVSKATEPLDDLQIPQLNLNVNLPAEQKKEDLVKAEQLVGYYNEILDDIRDDRKEIDEVLKSFLEMVMNEGDATTLSKEAVVNLLKMKAEQADKKTKVVDLLMRAFLKEKDTFPRYLAAHQHNEFKIDSGRKGKLLKAIASEGDNNAGK